MYFKYFFNPLLRFNFAFLFPLNFLFLFIYRFLQRYLHCSVVIKEDIWVKAYKEHDVWPSKRTLLKAFFSPRHIILQYPPRKLVYSFSRPSSFAPFLLSLSRGNFSPGRFSRSSFFSSPKTPNKCIPRELFFLCSGTHQSPVRVRRSIRVRRRGSGFLEAFSRHRYATRMECTLKSGYMFY